MKRSNKIIIGVIVVLIVISATVLAKQSNLFQGLILKYTNKLQTNRTLPQPQGGFAQYYQLYNKPVSAVTSPVTSAVPSVVVSYVTSPGGTSSVASVVTSPVASPVASAVAADAKTAITINTSALKPLTEDILKSTAKEYYGQNQNIFTKAAKEYYKMNPSKFTLPASEKKKLIELYKLKNPSQFFFIRKVDGAKIFYK